MQSLLNELRSNTRLRLGIWLIILILLIYGLLLLDDYKHKLIEQYADSEQQLLKLQSVAQQKHWEKRLQETSTLRIELENKLWRASSQGLARADFQAWLSIAIRHASLEKTRLKVEDIEVLTGTPTLWKVSAQIDGFFVAEPIAALLREIAKNPQLIVVEHLDIPPQGSRRFSLQVSAYFQANQS